jgi:hypothetical protein
MTLATWTLVTLFSEVLKISKQVQITKLCEEEFESSKIFYLLK